METIRIKESSGTEIELEQKIEKLERGLLAEYELFVSMLLNLIDYNALQRFYNNIN